MISLETWMILIPWQKLPKNVGDLDKLIVTKGFKNGPKSNKSPNLVTLNTSKSFSHISDVSYSTRLIFSMNIMNHPVQNLQKYQNCRQKWAVKRN